MRKFNPEDWVAIGVGKWLPSVDGDIEVRATESVSLIVAKNGTEALYGSGHSIHCLTSTDVEYTVIGPAKARIYVRANMVPVVQDDGAIYTNPDRLPHESGSLDAVRGEVYQLKRMQRQLQRQFSKQATANAPQPANPAPTPPVDPNAPAPAPAGPAGAAPAVDPAAGG